MPSIAKARGHGPLLQSLFIQLIDDYAGFRRMTELRTRAMCVRSV